MFTKSITIIALLLCCFGVGFAQQPYFQQKISYKIEAQLLEKEKAIKGNLQLTYLNQSPDTLQFIWFHIWPNAYSGEQTALALQLEKDKELKKKIKKTEKGRMDSLAFSSMGKKLIATLDPQNPDIIKVMLAQPLLHGAYTDIATPFYNKLPGYFSRSGESEGQFIATQWYPKPAVYDKDGWHQMPYLDMGEYYADFGSFDVSIQLPSDFMVGATGTLTNADELNIYRQSGKANHVNDIKNATKLPKPAAGMKTLRYTADSVHDFAWFAQRDFLVQYDTCQLASGKIIDVFTYYRPEDRKHWIKSVDHLKAGVRFYGNELGEYPHNSISAVQGPKNVNSGGMEYPMITLITVGEKNITEELEVAIVHEAGHNWLQGILATNERNYPWFDEGFNTYYQFKYEAQQKKNSVMGKSIPAGMKDLPADEFFNLLMQSLAQVPYVYAVDTHSADFDTKESYGITAYLKGAVWLYILQSRMGPDAFNKGMKDYYETWKFKHPTPDDFKKVMEKNAGFSLDDVFTLLQKQGKFI